MDLDNPNPVVKQIDRTKEKQSKPFSQELQPEEVFGKFVLHKMTNQYF
jgi:hypothetical protein